MPIVNSSSAEDHTKNSDDSESMDMWNVGPKCYLLSSFNYSTPLGKPLEHISNKLILPSETSDNIMTHLGAHICMSKTEIVYFDTDAVEVVLDHGCSVTLVVNIVMLLLTNQVLEKYKG